MQVVSTGLLHPQPTYCNQTDTLTLHTARYCYDRPVCLSVHHTLVLYQNGQPRLVLHNTSTSKDSPKILDFAKSASSLRKARAIKLTGVGTNRRL